MGPGQPLTDSAFEQGNSNVLGVRTTEKYSSSMLADSLQDQAETSAAFDGGV